MPIELARRGSRFSFHLTSEASRENYVFPASARKQPPPRCPGEASASPCPAKRQRAQKQARRQRACVRRSASEPEPGEALASRKQAKRQQARIRRSVSEPEPSEASAPPNLARHQRPQIRQSISAPRIPPPTSGPFHMAAIKKQEDQKHELQRTIRSMAFQPLL